MVILCLLMFFEFYPRGLYSQYNGSEHMNGVNYTSLIEDPFPNEDEALHVLTKVSSVNNSTNCTVCLPGATCN